MLLHGISSAIVLSQAMISSIYQPSALIVLASAMVGLFSASFGVDFPVVIKSAISAIILQATVLIGLPGSFSLGEASVISQIVTICKYLWGAQDSFNWLPIQQLGYISWLATVIAVMLTISLSNVLPLARNPATLIVSYIASIFGIFRMMKLSPSSLQDLFFNIFSSDGAVIALTIWITGFICALILSWILRSSEMDRSEEELGLLQGFRKSYHLLALMVFLPSGLYNVLSLLFLSYAYIFSCK